jgi:hypothetical protein
MSLTFTIPQLNDLLRSTFMTGRVLATPGIRALPEEVQSKVFQQVRAFEAFSPDNDPHGEHDFGSIEVEGAGKVFWKIDYYDPSMEAGSEDPADPGRTVRVLTIMLASEY